MTNLVQWSYPCPWQGLDKVDFEGPFQAKYPGILRQLNGNSIPKPGGWPRLSSISVGNCGMVCGSAIPKIITVICHSLQ